MFSAPLTPQFITAISTITFSTLFFLAILSVTKKSTSVVGYRFLSLFLIFLALNFADDALTISGLYLKYSFLTLVFQPGIYAIAPAFYLASVHLTSVNKKVKWKYLSHFIPYFLLVGLFIFALLLPPDLVATANNPESKHAGQVANTFLLSVLFVQIFWYLYLTIKQLKKHRQSLPLFVSSFTGNDYQWLSKIVMGLSVLSIIWLIETIVDKPLLSSYTSIIYLTSFYYIGVQIVQQKDIFFFAAKQSQNVADLINIQQLSLTDDLSSTTVLDSTENVYDDLTYNGVKKKVMSDEKVVQCKQKLLELMDLEKPYLDSEITLPKLSKMMVSNTYQISYLLNACFGENFYTFINRYRIEECKQMLKNPMYDHLTILGIAFESGFNSKTAFNTSFKKSTGMSPKEYKERADKEFKLKTSSSVSIN